MKIIFELPFYSVTCGGVLSTIKLAKEMGADVRFQRLTDEKPYNIGVNFTVGKPELFPACDWAISYSDNPYFNKLFSIRRIKRVGIFMQSYGMSIVNERRNALNKKALVLCTTKKIENAITADGGIVHRIGHGFDMQGFYDKGLERKNYLAIMYHDMHSKRYDTAVKVADMLFDNGIIEGVISFGKADGYDNHKHPKGLKAHFSNASKEDVATIFNTCKAYLMPSISEGLNITPIEATLCGCPSVIFDGAIYDIFWDDANCLVSNSDDNHLYDAVEYVIKNFDDLSGKFRKSMEYIIYHEYGRWSNVADNLRKLL